MTNGFSDGAQNSCRLAANWTLTELNATQTTRNHRQQNYRNTFRFILFVAHVWCVFERIEAHGTANGMDKRYKVRDRTNKQWNDEM